MQEERPKKKVKVDTRGKRLGDVLPAPKEMSILGAGAGAGPGAVRTNVSSVINCAMPTHYFFASGGIADIHALLRMSCFCDAEVIL